MNQLNFISDVAFHGQTSAGCSFFLWIQTLCTKESIAQAG
jgi:hypothetical protein